MSGRFRLVPHLLRGLWLALFLAHGAGHALAGTPPPRLAPAGQAQGSAPAVAAVPKDSALPSQPQVPALQSNPAPADISPTSSTAAGVILPNASPQIAPAGQVAASNLTLQNALQQTVLIEIMICVGFGLVGLGVQAWLLHQDPAVSPEAVLRNVTVTIVVTLGIAVVMTGLPQQQISPVIGLFGTIIGFLLGQTVRSEPSAKSGGGTQTATSAPASQEGGGTKGV